jgi:hypothetical protein
MEFVFWVTTFAEGLSVLICMIFIEGSIVGPQMALANGRHFVACIFGFYSVSVFLDLVFRFDLIFSFSSFICLTFIS